MKVGKIKTLWIILLSLLSTANTCGQAIIMRLTGRINRVWVDKALQRWINHLLNIVGIKCIVHNPYHVKPIPGRATIVMCNHTSMYDIPLSFKVFPDYPLRMLAKKELSRVPILGKGMAAAEFPFIDRKNRHQALKDLEAAKKLMESGIIIWIAPEGTRSVDGKLGTFKKGAFITAINAKAIIIPIGIQGAFDILPTNTLQFNIGQTAHIHVGKPIDASLFSMENKDALVEEVYAEMTKCLDQSHL